jgi:hypothetical protein
VWGRWHNPFFLEPPLLSIGLLWGLPGLGVVLWLLFRNWRRGRSGWGSARWIGAPVLAWCLLLAWPKPQIPAPALLVFGIDGATYEVADVLMAQGDLPTLASLEARGSRGVLRSMEPMFSPLLWTTMATGKIPEEHGIRGFRVQASELSTPRFWDVAIAEGHRVGIYKWLVTYPPRELDGFMVPAWLAPGPETVPQELSFIKELELSHRLKRQRVEAGRGPLSLAVAGVRGGLRLGTLVQAALCWWGERSGNWSGRERRLAMEPLRVEMDRDVFLYALRTQAPSVATFTDYATDGLAHLFWGEGEIVADAYRQADRVLGEILSSLDGEPMVVVLSDHGFRSSEAGGHVSLRPLTDRLEARLSESHGAVEVNRLGIKLRVRFKGEGDLTALEASVRDLLDSGGEPFYRVERIPQDPLALGLSLENEEVDEAAIAAGTVGGEPLSHYLRLAPPFLGDHDDAGILLAAGPGVPQLDLGEVELLDIAPSLLGLLGIAPADDQSGEVLFGTRLPGPASRDDLVGDWQLGEGEDGVDEERLRALGYVE